MKLRHHQRGFIQKNVIHSGFGNDILTTLPLKNMLNKNDIYLKNSLLLILKVDKRCASAIFLLLKGKTDGFEFLRG